MNLLRYLYLGCCAALDIMLLLFGFAGVAAFIEEPDPSVPLGMVFAFILCAVIMLGITIASFRKVRKGEKFPILPGFFLKIATIILTLGIIWFILEIPEAGWLAVVVAILIGVLIGVLPFSGAYPRVIPVLVLTLGFGIIGFIDDYLKVVLRRSDGLLPKQKMAGQLVVTTIFVVYLWVKDASSLEILIPFTGGYALQGMAVRAVQTAAPKVIPCVF